MSKDQALQKKLRDLTQVQLALSNNPEADSSTREKLQRALADGNNSVVARSAELINSHTLSGFELELTQAFDRFMRDAASTDKVCLAKTSIANTLYLLEPECPALFLQGIRHVQMEPAIVKGGYVDTAGNLRGTCGLALALLNHPTALFELTTLLMDSEVEARRFAAQALGEMECRESELLLRLKVLNEDGSPDVVVECLTAMIKVAPERSLPFVAEYLDHHSAAIREGAALAVGESRLPEA